MSHLYEIYSGEELKIAEKIQQRRYQMLVHSYIYYNMNENIVSDSKWSAWAVELAEMQHKYPDISKEVPYAKDFEGWDGSSGAFLEYEDKPNIILTANRLLYNSQRKQSPVVSMPKPTKQVPIKSSTPKKKLF
jgi:hypothetical protein